MCLACCVRPCMWGYKHGKFRANIDYLDGCENFNSYEKMAKIHTPARSHSKLFANAVV